jgi:hypothetical protein
MYINPFVAGILVTVMVEVTVLFTAAIVKTIKKYNGGNN